MIKQLLSAVTGYLFPDDDMKIPNPFALLLAPDASWGVLPFLSIYKSQILATKHPARSLRKAPRVKNMRFGKTKTGVQHEFLINEVKDEVGTEVKLVLERILHIDEGRNPDTVDGGNDILLHDDPPLDDEIVQQFMAHPDSKQLLGSVIDSVRETLQNVPPAVVVAGAAIVAAPLLTTQAIMSIVVPAAIPALLHPTFPATKDPDALYLLEEGYPPSYSPCNVSALTPEYSLTDQVTMHFAQALQYLIDTPPARYVSESLNVSKPKNARSDDRVMGSNILDLPAYANGTMLNTFQPKMLTLFHLVLLAYIVHTEYPLYSLFRGQCYWYASTIWHAAQIIDRNLLYDQHRSEYSISAGPFDHFFLPFDLRHANVSGNWRGIKITGSRRVVLDTVVRKFHTALDEFTAEVCHFLQNYDCLLNS
jgi:hypothetical protein